MPWRHLIQVIYLRVLRWSSRRGRGVQVPGVVWVAQKVPGGVVGVFDGAACASGMPQGSGGSEWRNRCSEDESWEPFQRAEAHPLSPSAHLPIERVLDGRVAVTDDTKCGASMPPIARQSTRYGAPAVSIDQRRHPDSNWG